MFIVVSEIVALAVTVFESIAAIVAAPTLTPRRQCFHAYSVKDIGITRIQRLFVVAVAHCSVRLQRCSRSVNAESDSNNARTFSDDNSKQDKAGCN